MQFELATPLSVTGQEGDGSLTFIATVIAIIAFCWIQSLSLLFDNLGCILLTILSRFIARRASFQYSTKKVSFELDTALGNGNKTEKSNPILGNGEGTRKDKKSNDIVGNGENKQT